MLQHVTSLCSSRQKAAALRVAICPSTDVVALYASRDSNDPRLTVRSCGRLRMYSFNYRDRLLLDDCDYFGQERGSLRRWFRLEFDCNSTALRPFDDLHYDRRPTCCGLLLLHCGLNK